MKESCITMKNLLKLILPLILATQVTVRAGRIEIRSTGPGADWVHLRDDTVSPAKSDPAATGLTSRALASADFDEDGVPDLVTGYANSGTGGTLSIQRGNLDAIYPNSPEAQARRERGEFTPAAFLPGSKSFSVPEAADFVGAGDFDADGHWDIVTARKGGDKLYWLRGDGHGGFAEPKIISLPGAITSLIAGEMNRADGLTDIAVGIVTQDGAQVLVFESPEGALRGAPETFPLPAAANALALGQLDDDRTPDLAIASGNEVVIIHGRDRKLSLDEERRADVKPAVVSKTVLDSPVLSVVVGDFVGDSGQTLAVLTADGRVRVLERDGHVAMTLNVATGLGDPASPTRLLAAKVSVLPKDDLLLFGQTKTVQLVTTSTASPSAPKNLQSAGAAQMSVAALLTSESEVMAVLPMRLNADALQDLVVANRDGVTPSIVLTQSAATFVVNVTGNTNDINPGDGQCKDADGNCSYAAAIQEVNARPGGDTITFNIPGGGPHVINTPTQYPNKPVTIDGTTQPGSRVELVLGGYNFPVIFYGGNSVLRGVAAYGDGGAIRLASDGNIVEGNYLGFRADGTKPIGSGSSPATGVSVNPGSNNLIGGTTAQARNVISNCGRPVEVDSGVGNIIRGNYIGTNVAGTAALPNSDIFAGYGDLTIGGTTAGAGNLISGNGSYQTIAIYGAALIQGNLIGTTADGTQPLANGGIGIVLSQVSNKLVTIGGTTPAARNVIAANSVGIVIKGPEEAGSGELIQGNFIGTNAAGTGALPNLSHGIQLGMAVNVTIGGTATGAGNLISGNGDDGINVGGAYTFGRAIIQGNLIGTDVNGVVAIPNSNGIQLPNSDGTIIGGTSVQARNVISGNRANGIRLTQSANGRIEGNYIGLNRFGTGALGNSANGVLVESYYRDTVGGTASGSSNTIAFNGGAGVASASRTLLLTSVVANSIRDNGGLGIDIYGDGVTKNTPGSGSNYPVITSVQSSDTGTTIQGTLQNGNYTAGITYTLQFFSNTKVDPSGYGEGETYLGKTTITTDGTTSPRSFSLTVTPAVPPGRFITAVASGKDQFNQDGYEYLSEFSFAAKVAGNTTPQNTPLRLNVITPMAGGDTGGGTVTIIGEGISQNATVRLRRLGQNDIVGASVFVSTDGSSLIARFNLIGQAQGAWDVVVTNADGTATILPGAYTIEAGREAKIWTDLLGRTRLLKGRAGRYTVVCGNSGNTDAYGVPVFITGIPKDAKITLGFDLLPIPQTGPKLENFSPSEIPAIIQMPSDQMIPIIIPVIPVGTVRTVSFTIEPPANQANPNFTLRVTAWAPVLRVVDSRRSAQNSPRQTIGINAPGEPSIQLELSENGAACRMSFLTNTASCLANFLPGVPCAKLAYNVASLSSSLGLILNSPPATASQVLVSTSQLLSGLFSTVFAGAQCFGSVTPAGPLLNGISCGLSLVGTLVDCGSDVFDLPVLLVKAIDPNDKVGANGSGNEHFTTGVLPLRYMVFFENKPEATAPAHEVVIADQLDTAKLDLATFQLGPISFGNNTVVTPPSGLSEWTTDVDLRPANNLVVRVVAALNKTTGLVTWHFFSLDPVTLQPTDDPAAGFLPPNVTAPEGDGAVVYTIKAKPNQPTGTEIRNQAQVIFDTNAPINTPTWLNTIDNSPPISMVIPLAANQGSTHFQVTWSGTDAGAGIASYTIYVSENGSAFRIWLENTTLTSAFYDATPNASVAFYSVARDSAGNIEAAHASPDATVSVTPSGQLLNIATRLRVQTGDNVLIGGFIITGTDAKKVLIRGIGPSLANFGITNALGDTTLELYQGNTLLASNDNWKVRGDGSSQQAEIEATTIPPSNDLESAILRSLAPGAYTAVLRGKNNLTGIGVVESYDLDQPANSKLANIATRGFVDINENVMIGGLIVGGHNGSGARVLVRAIGPSLTAFGVPGALADPVVELRDGNGSKVAENDDWKQTQQTEIQATTLAPTNDLESAVLTTVPAGNFTAIVRGFNNTTGVALVEVYNLQ
jgi:hypothetical protein